MTEAVDMSLSSIASLAEAARDIAAAADLPALEQIRLHWLGKKGLLTRPCSNLDNCLQKRAVKPDNY
jgi:hypothetical protein